MTQSDPQLRWWVKLAWRLYTPLPPVADELLNQGLRSVSLLRSLRVPVVLLRGRSRCDGRPGTVVIAGAVQGIDYLIHRFFDGEPRREMVGKAPLWNLARTLQRLQATADLTIVRMDRFSARLLFDDGYLAVPEWVGTLLTLPEQMNALTDGNYKLRRELRRVSRGDLTSELSQTEEDFETFYHTMYVPFIRSRYGEHAVIRSIHWLRRIFHHGGLLWVRQNGQPIAGLLFQRRQQLLRSIVLGTLHGEWAPMEAHASAALYFALVKHAKALGCQRVDFGSCRPSLNDGVLRYKRKWDVSLVEQRKSYCDLLVHWNRFSGPVAAFLAHTPLIFRDRSALSARSRS